MTEAVVAELRAGTAREAEMAPEAVERVRGRLREWVEKGELDTVVALAARHGVIVLHEATGYLTPERRVPLQTNALFPIQSVTKLITATCAMILVEDGLLGLNRPVREYAPEVRGEGTEAVMVHHLLTHTSGWEDEAILAYTETRRGQVEAPPCPADQYPALHEVLYLRRDAPLVCPPGQKMAYCGFHYTLLGEIVRRVSGQSLQEFAQARLFDPLGMRDTYFVVPDEESYRVVHRKPHAADAEVDNREFELAPYPSSGVYSTAFDIAVFCQTFLNGGTYAGARVLSRASVTEMTRNQIPGVPSNFIGQYFPEASWGYGWSVHGNKRGLCGTLHSPESFEHWGSGGIYVWADPRYDIVGVYFSVLPRPEDETGYFRSDLFTDAVTAAAQDDV